MKCSSMSFKKAKNNISKEELESYYSMHSTMYTSQRFCVSNYVLNRLLKYYEIPMHTPLENSQMTCMEKYGVQSVAQLSEVNEKKRYALTKKKDSCRLNDKLSSQMQQELLQYYTCHSDTSTREKFSISEKILLDILKEYNIQRHTSTENHSLTCLEKYGTSSYSKTPEFLEKIKHTYLEKYGVEYGLQCEEIKKKSRKTCFKKYGVQYSFQSDNNKQKSKQTRLEKYNDKNYNNREKANQTCLEKYGVSCYMKSAEFREKSKQSCMKKYGVEYPAQNVDIYNKTHSKYYYNNYWFDSSWELCYYIYLVDHDIEFVYKPDYKFSYTVKNTVHYYLPDFLVGNQLIELKGDQFFDDNGNFVSPYKNSDQEIYSAKYQCMIDNNIKIFRQQEIQKYIDYVDSRYGKNYVNQFRKGYYDT